jgi:hypothetical protein
MHHPTMKPTNRIIKRLRFLTVLGTLCGGLWSATVVAQTHSPAPWVSLFNGKDLSGWTIKGDPAGKVWVKDGEIICNQTTNTTEHTYACTAAKYGDYILETDVKIDGAFSSGIILRCVDVPESERRIKKGQTGRSSLFGYQVKIDPTPRKWTGGIYDDSGPNAQWYYSLEKDARAQEAFKLGEWNTFRIEAIGKDLKVWINGVPVTHLVHGKFTGGYIAFKIHWLDAKTEQPKVLGHFKNIRIITEKPAAYARAMDLPAKIVE